ncbi:ATP-binding cassette domain-containing protein [Teichococcus cervicalis]
MSSLVEIRDLRVDFPTPSGFNPAVRGISFSMGREKLGIVGESGSGKSVTGRALMRLLPQAARVRAEALRFDGIDVQAASERQMRSLRGGRIGLIMQDPKYSLNPVMTVGRQISEAWLAHNKGGQREAREAALTLLEQVKIRDPRRVLESYPHEVSGGMGQRVMIAMMLAPQPGPADRRRADQRAGCQRAGRDPEADRGSGLRPRHGADADQPRSAAGQPLLRPRRRHVCRPGDGGAAGARPAPRQPRLHARPAGLHAEPVGPPRASADAESRPRLAGAAPMIEIENLNVHFGANHVVRDVSFRVEAGETFGLVGESGSGKSTVLRTIAGLNGGWDGGMAVAGKPLGPKRDRAFFKTVQMVFQDPYGSLHPRQTVDRILSEPLEVHGIPDAEQRITRALEEVALPRTARFRYPHQLSGGQRQRVAIARALIADPSVLLLDEPTSALDVSVQAEVLNLLADLRQARQLTCILVSHNLAVIAHLCERLAVMQGGRIVETLTEGQLREGDAHHPHTRDLIALSHELE